ncbi:MAG: hypothetical protein M3R67_04410 [Acidobacteriota bacterium]|nr:hypothetical protein [Acidobacteriota bacterium]
MAKDDRAILELLKDELALIEQGGYGRSVRTPWLAKSAFQDSLTSINYSDPAQTRPCNECHLIGRQFDEREAVKDEGDERANSCGLEITSSLAANTHASQDAVTR